MAAGEQAHKQHRVAKSGPTAKRKQKADKKKRGVSTEHKNPKAFGFQSSVKVKRLHAISAEKDQRRLHVPVLDRTAEEPPPYVVVVQGPPQWNASQGTLLKAGTLLRWQGGTNLLQGGTTLLKPLTTFGRWASRSDRLVGWSQRTSLRTNMTSSQMGGSAEA